jgi:hypothetical protein
MQTMTTLIPIFFFFLLGMAFARTELINSTDACCASLLGRIVLLTLSAMLFFMGVRIGVIENIGQKLVQTGLISVSFAVATFMVSPTLFLSREPMKEA